MVAFLLLRCSSDLNVLPFFFLSKNNYVNCKRQIGDYQGSYKVALKFANMFGALLKAPWTFLLEQRTLNLQ
jgi:hypothetical protein